MSLNLDVKRFSTPLKFVTREMWGAMPARKRVRLEHPVEQVGFCYVNPTHPLDSETVKRLQREHIMAYGMFDIQTNFVIGRDGLVYEGRGWDFQPSKRGQGEVPVERKKFLEIAIIGNVNNSFARDHPMIQAALKLIDYGRYKRYIESYFYFLGEKIPKKEKLRWQYRKPLSKVTKIKHRYDMPDPNHYYP